MRNTKKNVVNKKELPEYLKFKLNKALEKLVTKMVDCACGVAEKIIEKTCKCFERKVCASIEKKFETLSL